MKGPYPTVSTRGFITEPLKAVDQMLADFFVTNYSQSICFKGSLSSAVYILQQAADDNAALTAGMRDALQVLLSRYFDNVTVTASIQQLTDEGKQNMFDLRIGATFTSDGVKYDIVSIGEIDKSQMRIIQKEMQGVN